MRWWLRVKAASERRELAAVDTGAARGPRSWSDFIDNARTRHKYRLVGATQICGNHDQVGWLSCSINTVSRHKQASVRNETRADLEPLPRSERKSEAINRGSWFHVADCQSAPCTHIVHLRDHLMCLVPKVVSWPTEASTLHRKEDHTVGVMHSLQFLLAYLCKASSRESPLPLPQSKYFAIFPRVVVGLFNASSSSHLLISSSISLIPVTKSMSLALTILVFHKNLNPK